MPYTYIYLYIVVVGIIFPLVSLCAHTITHTSMTMMYSVAQETVHFTAKFEKVLSTICTCIMFVRNMRKTNCTKNIVTMSLC